METSLCMNELELLGRVAGGSSEFTNAGHRASGAQPQSTHGRERMRSTGSGRMDGGASAGRAAGSSGGTCRVRTRFVRTPRSRRRRRVRFGVVPCTGSARGGRVAVVPSWTGSPGCLQAFPHASVRNEFDQRPQTNTPRLGRTGSGQGRLGACGRQGQTPAFRCVPGDRQLA